MKKTAFALLLASLLTGCGASAVPAVYAPSARAVQAQAETAKLDITLTKVRLTVLESKPTPWNSHSFRNRTDFIGRMDGQPMTVVVIDHNPGSLYIANLEKVTVNGKALQSKPEIAALAVALEAAIRKEGTDFFGGLQATSVMRFGARERITKAD